MGPYPWMLLGAAAFAVMATLSRAAADLCDWRIVALARAGLMLVFAALFARLRRVPLVFPGPRALWVRSLAGSASLTCTFYAYTHLPVGDATTLVNMTPVWVAILSWPILGERPSARIWAAVAVSLAGVVLVAQPHFATASLGAVAGAASSLFTATVMMSLSKLRGVDPRAIVVHFSVFATATAAVLFAAAPEARADVAGLSATAVALLLSLALAGTVGQIGLTRAFAQGSAPRVALVGMSQIPIAVTLELLFLGRRYDLRSIVGMALVIAPAAWILLKKPVPPAAES